MLPETSDPSTTLLSNMKKNNSTFLASSSEQLCRLILSLTYIKTNLIAHIQAQQHSEGWCQRWGHLQYPKTAIPFPAHWLCPLYLKMCKFISNLLPYVVITTDSPKCIKIAIIRPCISKQSYNVIKLITYKLMQLRPGEGHDVLPCFSTAL